jgi:hypothetical protein
LNELINKHQSHLKATKFDAFEQKKNMPGLNSRKKEIKRKEKKFILKTFNIKDVYNIQE